MRLVVEHRPQRTHGHAMADRIPHVDQEHLEPVRPRPGPVHRRSPSEQDHEVRVLDPRRVHIFCPVTK